MFWYGDDQKNIAYGFNGGANNGTRTLTIPKEDVLAAMKKDLDRVRAMMAKANL